MKFKTVVYVVYDEVSGTNLGVYLDRHNADTAASADADFFIDEVEVKG